MPQSSLVIIDGDQMADGPTGYEYAELAGIKFIELRHKAGAARASQSARGFQGVTIRVRENREGGRTFRAEWSERNGAASRAHRPLVFDAVGRTRILTGYLPDSPFNRDKLAGFYYEQSAFWAITNPAILAEVKKAADVKKANEPKGPTKDQVIGTQSDEIRVLKEKLVLEKRSRMAAEEQAKVVQEAARTVKELPKERLEAVREIVHEKCAAIIATLKEQSPNGWANTKKYKELIQPQIDEMVNSELEKMNAEHAGVSV